jgi:hypothetical protein
MPEIRATEYVAECFWPGVLDADLQALDERIVAAAAELSGAGEDVRYLGSMLMRVDEVVLCLFAGSEAAVRSAVELAAVPCERILEAARSPWPKVVSP